MVLLDGKEITVGYEGHKITGPITFAVEAGDYLFIVGENGSGKSTLMKTILGLLPPIAGEITFADGLRQNEIGYLPQQTELQKDFPASVQEIVLSGCLGRRGRRPFYSRREKEIVRANLAKLGAGELGKRAYRELSGGQQQRVLLARALCAGHRLLLLDEPLAGLDPMAAADMYRILQELNERDEMTIITVSHDIAAAVRYATCVLHIKDDTFFFGSKEEYLQTDMGKLFACARRGEMSWNR